MHGLTNAVCYFLGIVKRVGNLALAVYKAVYKKRTISSLQDWCTVGRVVVLIELIGVGKMNDGRKIREIEIQRREI